VFETTDEKEQIAVPPFLLGALREKQAIQGVSILQGDQVAYMQIGLAFFSHRS
jgi:hypothetical protein